MAPSVRTDGLHIWHAMRVLPLRRFERQQGTQLVALILRAVLPIRLDWFSEIVVDSFVVGVTFLDDQRFASLGMLDS
jgi:hypothetical protein